MPGSNVGPFSRSLNTGTLNDCGTYPVSADIDFVQNRLANKKKTVLTSFVGIELEREIIDLSSYRLIWEKQR